MNVQKSIGGFIERFGCQVTLQPGGSGQPVEYKAFLQPLRYKNKMYLDGTRTRIGWVDESHYLYVGPPEVEITALAADARLTMDGKEYFFTRAEQVAVSGKCVYQWAVLRGVEEESA